MKTSILIAIAAVVAAAAIAGGFIGYNAFVNPSSTTNPTTGPTGAAPTNAATATPVTGITPESIRDLAFQYIDTNHNNEIGSLASASSLSWSSATQSTDSIGRTVYSWTSGNWKAEVTCPNAPSTMYLIYGYYTDPTSSRITIEWKGDYTDGTLTQSNWSHIIG